MTDAELDQLCINTIRTLSIDAVQAANSGHPGTPMALAPLVRLRDGDRSIPAARVRQDRALLLADRAAAERLGSNEEREAGK